MSVRIIKKVLSVFSNGGSEIQRPSINFIDGSGATVGVAEDSANNRIDVTVGLAAGGNNFSFKEVDDAVTVTIPTFQEMSLSHGISIRGSLIVNGYLFLGAAE